MQKIQEELFVPKGQKNDFGKYNYRSCEDILVAVKPICAKHNCVLRLGDAIPIPVGDRVYIKTTVQLYDLDSCTTTTTVAYAREESDKKGMDGSQITGASTSYARKYALAGLFCIDNEKDSDKTSTKRKDGSEVITNENGEAVICEGTGEESTTISAAQIDIIHGELERTGISKTKLLDRVKKKSIEQMTKEDYVLAMASFKKTADKKKEN